MIVSKRLNGSLVRCQREGCCCLDSIIAGYTLHGYSEEALDLYYEMQSFGVKIDQFTYSIVIRICAWLGSLEHAKQIHADLV